MSLNLEKGTAIAYVNGGEINGEIIYVDTNKQSEHISSDDERYEYEYDSEDETFSDQDESENTYSSDRIKIKDGLLEPIIDPSKRSIYYVCGKSGSGKSTFAAHLAMNYSRMYPENNIYLFSVLESDQAFDEMIPNIIKKIPIDENILDIDFNNDFGNEGTLVIFDDIDTENNKELAKAIANLKDKIMELGRHKNISMILISHLINPKKASATTNNTQTIMNEMTHLVIFPNGGGSRKQQAYCLENYLGYDSKEIKTILKLPSRWVVASNTYPQYVMYDHGIMLEIE